MPFPGEVKHVAQPLLFEPAMEVYGRVHHRIVMAQRGVWVAFVKAVVNQQRPVVVVRHPAAYVHGGVFVGSKQGLQPNDHRTIANGCLLVR